MQPFACSSPSKPFRPHGMSPRSIGSKIRPDGNSFSPAVFPSHRLARIIHERLRPSRGSFPPDTSSDLLCDAPGIAVVGLPRPDEKSLAGTRCSSASCHLGVKDLSSLNNMLVFRPGVREL